MTNLTQHCSIEFSPVQSGGTATAAGPGTIHLPVEDITAEVQRPPASRPAYPEELAKFLDAHYPDGLIHANESFHTYRDGYWQQIDERSDLRRRIVGFYGANATNAKTANLLGLLRDSQARRGEEVIPNRNLIALTNGTLDTTTYQRIPHSPGHWLRSRTNIVWDPEASCPGWLQFLDQIFAHDSDKAEKISFVQQWFGYCLVPDTSLHKFLWLVGSGGNGKSVLLSVLTHLVGVENVSHAHVEQLGKSFVRAELEGKLLNISSEICANAKMADGYLKQIVSGEMLQAERKFKPSFSFRPYVRLVAATNHLPRLSDLSNGFFRRAIILTFNRQFAQAEQDFVLAGKLLGELPGILIWAVQGLRQLRERESFVIPPSSVDALHAYRTESDPERMFIDSCLAPVAQGGMSSAKIYAEYCAWCKKCGFPARNIISLGKRLADFNFSHRHSRGKKLWMVAAKPSSGVDWNL